MNFEFFIARGFGRGKIGARPNIMVRIATLSVALGVAAMIVTSAVIGGFGRELERRLTGFTAHVRVSATGVYGSSEESVFVREERVEQLLSSLEGFRSMDSYVQRSGIVKSNDAVEGLLLKGYDGNGGSFFEKCIVEGEMPRTGDSVRYKDILISRVTAERLEVAAGDKIEMLFIDGNNPPRRDRFTVSGIYSSGMDESDRLLALTDIRNVRRLVDASNNLSSLPAGKGNENLVSGYEVLLDRMDLAGSFADDANRRLLYDDNIDSPLLAESLYDLYPVIFEWRNTHDVNAAVIFVLMLTVALFNVISALLIMVLERTRTVGVLKALGTDNASLRRIFLWRALFVVVKGVLWGDAVGVGLCLLQKYGHFIKLDPAGYILSEMPVHIVWWQVAAIDAGAVAVIIAGLLIPARIVASIRPDEAVRYE